MHTPEVQLAHFYHRNTDFVPRIPPAMCSGLAVNTAWQVGSCLLKSSFPNFYSCSICTKKQNRHFIVPASRFKLLQVGKVHEWGGPERCMQ